MIQLFNFRFVNGTEENMTEATRPLIEIEDLTKVFYTDEIETHALSGVHLAIRKGEYIAISGPSGCGKSTLLSIMGLLDTPTGGKYQLNGQAGREPGFRRSDRAFVISEIGFIFQSFNLIGDLTVYENVELPLTYRQKMPSAERKKRVMESLERVGMAHRYGIILRNSPAVSSNAWPLHARLADILRSCSLMSQPETWTLATAKQ